MVVCGKANVEKRDMGYRERQERIMKGEMSMSFFEIPPISPFDLIEELYEERYLTRDSYEALMTSIYNLCEDADVLDSLEFVMNLLDNIEIYRGRRFKDMLRPDENLVLIVALMKYFLAHEKYRER